MVLKKDRLERIYRKIYKDATIRNTQPFASRTECVRARACVCKYSSEWVHITEGLSYIY